MSLLERILNYYFDDVANTEIRKKEGERERERVKKGGRGIRREGGSQRKRERMIER